MRRALIATALAAAGIAATPAVIAASEPATSQSTATATATPTSFVYAQPFDGGRDKYVDLAKHGIGPGDMFLFTEVPMLSEDTTTRIGLIDGTETIASARHDGTVEMNMTLRLPDGLVMVAGVVRHNDKPFALPVVGGTGAYSHATGQWTQLREDRREKVTIIRVDLEH